MPTLKALFCAVGIAAMLSSCAGTYNSINPQTLAYGYAPKSNTQVQLGYHHNVLTEHRNKKFARKEHKKNIQLIAIKVTNNTNRSLTVGQDIQMYSGSVPVLPLDQEITYKSLRQQAPLFLLYLLLTPSQFYYSDGSSTSYSSQNQVESFPIGLILGPGLAIGNMLVASSNNKKFEEDLTRYNLMNRTIAPGETVHGLIGTTKSYTEPLEMRIITVHPVEASDDYYKEN